MITETLAFLTEIDRLKGIERQSCIIGGARRENSAEHSWHLAMFALVLGADMGLDMLSVIRMLLIHDLVEIDAGDVPLHSPERGNVSQHQAEKMAAERIFGLLPAPISKELMDAWLEFETGSSPEARFARAMDKAQPLILNIMSGGGTWVENNITEATVAERYGRVISDSSGHLWQELRVLVSQHFDQER